MAQVRRRDFTVTNKFDIDLHCSHWAPLSSAPHKTPCVLYLHGNSSCRVEALQAMRVALELGASLCCFDSGGSGWSDGEYVSLGYFEKFDAEAVLNELRAAKLCDGKVALWGRSMGAVTALLTASQLDPLVSCVVADSPFSSIPDLCHDLLDKHAHVSGLVVDAAISVVASSVDYRAGFDVRSVDARKAMPSCVCPLCFIHGDRDSFIDIKHSKALLDAATSSPDSTLLIHADGEHNSRRPDSVVSLAAVFLMKHLRKELRGPKAEAELRSCLAIVEAPLNSPPFPSLDMAAPTQRPSDDADNAVADANFVSGASNERQAKVKATLANAFGR